MDEATAEMTGGVVSLLRTVTVTAAETLVLPAASRATPVKVWDPSAAALVSQEIPYRIQYQLDVHYAVGYTHLGHLAPVFAGLAALAAGLLLSRSFLLARNTKK